MPDPTCANCGYETDKEDLSELKLCQTCDNAYQMGYIDGKNRL